MNTKMKTVALSRLRTLSQLTKVCDVVLHLRTTTETVLLFKGDDLNPDALEMVSIGAFAEAPVDLC